MPDGVSTSRVGYALGAWEGRGWLVARISKGDVLEACEKMRSLGLEVYCPLVPVTLRRGHTRRSVVVMQPAYLNWVFVRGDPPYSRMAKTAGLHVRIMFHGEEVLTDDQVSGIKHQESLWTKTTVRKPPPKDRVRMEPGSSVVIGAGAFSGQRVLVVEDQGHRVQVDTATWIGKVFISAFLIDFPEA